jgi:ligand-binding sensor domain-containing protein
MREQFTMQPLKFINKIFVIIFIFSAGASFIPLDTARAFSASISDQTSGEPYPHILKKQTFDLNTRNIKVLTSQGRHLWMGTGRGVIRYDTNTSDDYEVYDNQNHLLSNGIFSITFDSQNLPWIGTYGGGLSHLNGKHWSHYNTPQGLNDAFVYDIEFDKNILWLATWSGVNRVTGNPSDRKNWQSFTVENTEGGLIDDWVYAVEIESAEKLWFGTESGVSSFHNGKWQAFNHKDGLGAPYEQVQQENQGIMSLFQGQHHFSQASPSIPNLQTSDYRPNYVVSMLLDENNLLWIGTWGGGLSLLDTQTLAFRNFTVKDGLPGNFILSLELDKSGGLWIGTNDGLSRFNGKTFQNFSAINGLKSKFIFSIEAASDHSLWVGGNSSLTRLILDPESGVPLNIN